MVEMAWRIKTAGKEHTVRYTTGLEDGEVLVDDNIVDSKGSSFIGVLIQKFFKIEGKPAKVRRRSLLNESWELVYDDKVYAPPERAGLPIKTREAGNGKD